MLKKILSHKWIVVSIICLLSVGLRLWFNSQVCFHTDQSRDAIVAHRILNGDLQLFGPVVSGGGALFHGVLYYYFIAPLYLIGSGNPLFVNLVLSVLMSFSLFPTYILAEKLLKKGDQALIVTFLAGLSATAIEFSGSFWNLTVSMILLPLFCLWAYKFLYKQSIKNALGLGLLLGLLVQSGLSNIQWIFPIVILFFVLFKRRKNKKQLWLSMGATLTAFIGTISSMIVVELLALKRGLFTMNESLHWLSAGEEPFASLSRVLGWSFNSLAYFLSPFFFPALILVVFLIISGLTLRKIKLTDTALIYLSFLVTPILSLFLTNWHSYTFAGYESIFYILVVFIVHQTLKQYFSTSLLRKITAFLLIAFTVSNLAMLYRHNANQETFTCMLNTNWKEKLEAIDYTYQQAAEEAFSIDVVSEPYGVNSTYGYLYSWYGKKMYGYTPVFTGPSQVGLISEGLLSERREDLATSSAHFVLYEPGTYNFWFKRRSKKEATNPQSFELFYKHQPPVSQLKAEQKFGNIEVEYYQP